MLMIKFKHENSKVKEQVVKDPKMLHIHLNIIYQLYFNILLFRTVFQCKDKFQKSWQNLKKSCFTISKEHVMAKMTISNSHSETSMDQSLSEVKPGLLSAFFPHAIQTKVQTPSCQTHFPNTLQNLALKLQICWQRRDSSTVSWVGLMGAAQP